MTLKIIGGTLKSRILKTPKGEQTRPTLAIVRKSVFDILQTQVVGSDFLDLFAGSGAMGIEALSRGARHAFFVEQHPLSFTCIKQNLETLRLMTQATLLKQEVLTALTTLKKKGKTADIIYIDPPYAFEKEKLLSLLHTIDQHSLLNEGGTLFVEESAPATPFPPFSHLTYLNSRTFSQTLLHQFLRKSKYLTH